MAGRLRCRVQSDFKRDAWCLETSRIIVVNSAWKASPENKQDSASSLELRELAFE